jgi:hypothetical protein
LINSNNDVREEKMRRVILESPYRGIDPEETAVNVRYAKACMLDSLRRGESPLASHLLWPGILDDADPAERAAGIAAGLAWGPVADATVVYVDRGISPGMMQGIVRAHNEGRPMERRKLADLTAHAEVDDK